MSTRQAVLRASRLADTLKQKMGLHGHSLSVRKKLKEKWVVDSGSCYDIVGSQHLTTKDKSRIRRSTDPVIMQTANGVISEDRVVDMPISPLNCEVEAVVLDKCPNVLSLGHRCMIDGYSFEWKAFENPTLTDPKGNVIVLDLDWLVPVLPTMSVQKALPASCGTENFEALHPADPAPTPTATTTPKVQGGTSAAPTTTTDTLPPGHELTHFPKLSTCKICSQSKSQRAPCRKKRKDTVTDETDGIDETKPEKFGDLITADHSFIGKRDEPSHDGDTCSLIVMDRYSHYVDCFPANDKSAGRHSLL